MSITARLLQDHRQDGLKRASSMQVTNKNAQKKESDIFGVLRSFREKKNFI